MILVFISRDDEEFNRYLRGCDYVMNGYVSHRVPELSLSPHSVSTDVENPNDDNPDPRIKNYRPSITNEYLAGTSKEKNIEVEYKFPLKSLFEFHRGGPFVVVIRSDVEINQMKKRCKAEEYQLCSTEDFLTLVSEVVNEALPKQSSKLNEHELHLLVHWGGVNELEVEENKFKNAIDTKLLEKKVGCRTLVFHEISSRRPCFDVTQQKITVPVEIDDVNALLKSFDDARTFVQIKDVLTQFVVQGETLKKDLVCEFLARDDVRKDLRTALCEPQVEWLKKWKTFREYLDVACEVDASTKALKMLNEEKDKLKAFVTQLLTMPQLLSEGLLL